MKLSFGDLIFTAGLFAGIGAGLERWHSGDGLRASFGLFVVLGVLGVVKLLRSGKAEG